MRWTVALALVTTVLLANVARAQQDQERGPKAGDYAPSVSAKEWIVAEGDEPPNLSELRGLVVVLVFWVSWHDGGEQMMPYITEASNNYDKQGIMVIGLTDADRKATQPIIEGAKVFFPVGCQSQSAKEYGFENGWGAVIIDTEGKIAWKGQPQGLGEGRAVFDEIFKNQKPTRTHPSRTRVVLRNIDGIKKAIANEQYLMSNKDLDEALELAVLGDKLRSEVLELLDLMNLIGQDRMNKAEVLLETGDTKGAAENLRFVMRRFKGLQCSRDARKRIEELSQENDEFKKRVSEYGDEDTAYKMLNEARELVRQRKIGDAWEKLDTIVKKYASTEAAGHAQAMIDRMNKIDLVAMHVKSKQKEGDGKNWIANAKSLARSGKIKEARDLLKRVMDECNGTFWAEEAKQELIKLPAR